MNAGAELHAAVGSVFIATAHPAGAEHFGVPQADAVPVMRPIAEQVPPRELAQPLLFANSPAAPLKLVSEVVQVVSTERLTTQAAVFSRMPGPSNDLKMLWHDFAESPAGETVAAAIESLKTEITIGAFSSSDDRIERHDPPRSDGRGWLLASGNLTPDAIPDRALVLMVVDRLEMAAIQMVDADHHTNGKANLGSAEAASIHSGQTKNTLQTLALPGDDGVQDGLPTVTDEALGVERWASAAGQTAAWDEEDFFTTLADEAARRYAEGAVGRFMAAATSAVEIVLPWSGLPLAPRLALDAVRWNDALQTIMADLDEMGEDLLGALGDGHQWHAALAAAAAATYVAHRRIRRGKGSSADAERETARQLVRRRFFGSPLPER